MPEWSLKGEAALGLQVYIPSAQCFLCGPAPLAPPTPTPTQDSVPTGDPAKANSTEEVSLCYQNEREGGRDVLPSPSVGPVRMCTQAVMTPWSCYVCDVAVS